MKTFSKLDFSKLNFIFIFYLILAFNMWLGVLYFGNSTYADEGTHERQIARFIKGNYNILSDLTTIPGYHITIATIAGTLHAPGANDYRFISLLLSLATIYVFFKISKKLENKNDLIKTIQFIFLPISFYYFPLIYTDIFGLLFVLLAFYFALNKRFHWSALFSIASLLVRQNNIVWIAFIWIYFYVKQNDFSITRQLILSYLKQSWSFLFVFISFIAFVIYNHGIAIGDRKMQQVGFFRGNIYFFLFVAAFLFLPLLINSLFALKKEKLKTFLTYGIGAGALIALTFLLSLPELHVYNLKLKFVRNIALNFAYGNYTWSYVFGIVIGYLAIFQMQFKKYSIILLPFAIISLVPSMLIEQRYYIVPFVFLLLFRKQQSAKIEWILAGWFILIASILEILLLRYGIFF